MDTFLEEIDAFLNRTGMAVSKFGQQFAKDPGFVPRIRGGRDCGLRKADEVRAAMLDYMASHPAPQKDGEAA